MRRSSIPLVATWVVLVFFYLPIAVLTWQSFNSAKYGGEWSGFTLRWYGELFGDRAIWLAVKNTLVVACVTTAVSVVFGTAAAWALHRYRTRLQRAHYLLVYAPLVVPDILMGISLLLFYVSLKVQLGLATVIVAHVTFCISYVAFVVLGRLQDFDDAVIEAAQDLGATPWQTLTRVVLPVLAPGVVAGGLLAFTLSVDDFVITFFVSGPGATTLPVHIYSMIRHGSTTVINALSVLFMAASFGLAIVSQVILRERGER